MLPNVRNGKLIRAPAGVEAALKRRRQLKREIARVEQHLGDPSRRATYYKTDEAYRAWRQGAERARSILRDELRLLTDWLVERVEESEEALREAHGLLKKLELEELEFDDEERAVIAKLDERFKEG